MLRRLNECRIRLTCVVLLSFDHQIHYHHLPKAARLEQSAGDSDPRVPDMGKKQGQRDIAVKS